MHPLLERLYFASPPALQSALVSAYGRRQAKRRYGDDLEPLLTRIAELDRATAEQARRHADERLIHIVRHAAAHVPWYRRRYAEAGIDVDAFRGVDDLARLPILEKEAVREDPAAFRSPDWSDRRFVTQTTSGSTGTPLQLEVDRETYRLVMALLVHHETEGGVAFGARRATFAGRMVQRATSTRPPYWRFNSAENQMLFSAYHLAADTVADYVRGLDAFLPEELIGYPSALAALASLMEEAGLSLAFRPKLVVTNSETLFDWQREVIERVLRAPVADYYGSAEYLVFAWERPGVGYRSYPGLGWMETVDEAGRPVFETAGDLLCTTLTNDVMPLIRYRVGDRATLADPAALPEAGGQVLRGIEGRRDDVVITRDGRRVGRLDHIFKGVEGIRECQLVQDDYERFTLNIVAAGESVAPATLQLLQENLEHRLGCTVAMQVNELEAVPRGANGKFKGVVSHVDPPEPADPGTAETGT